MTTLRDSLNVANPNSLADAARKARLGSLLSQAPRFLDSAVTTNAIVLPADAKASQLLGAFASAGTATGGKTVVGASVTLAANQARVNDAGDIEFFGTDAVSQAEIYYVTNEGSTQEELVTVNSNVGLFAASRKGVEILSALVETGVTPNTPLVPIARGGTPALGEIALSIAGTGFDVNVGNVDDGSVTVTYKTTPGAGTALDPLGASLDATNTTLTP